MMNDSQIKDIPEICLGMTARLASRMTTKILGILLKPLDLDPTQFPILVMLYLHPGIVVAALSNLLDIEASGISRNIQTLEKKGLVTSSGGRGRQGKQLTLSPAGYESFKRALLCWQEAQRMLIAELGEKEFQDAQKAMKDVSAAAQRIIMREENRHLT